MKVRLIFLEVTDIAINTNPTSNFTPKLIYFLKNYISGEKKFEIFKRYHHKLNLKKEIEKIIWKK